MIDFADNLLALFDGVVKGFMEVVGGSVEKLNKVVWCEFWDHIESIFTWDVELVVSHWRRPEKRH